MRKSSLFLSLLLTTLLAASIQIRLRAAGPDEIAALTALYNATDGPNWTNNTNWLNGLDPCDFAARWFGVVCDGSGNVRRLLLQNNQLKGAIPSALKDLKNLEFMQLQYNQINGSIPPELSRLVNLQLIYLYNNQLSGCFPEELYYFCDPSVNINFSNNPGLPWGGDFQRFCNGEDQPNPPCNDPDIVDFCEGLSISAGPRTDIACDTCLALLSGAGPVGSNYRYEWQALDGSALPYGNEGLQVTVPSGNLYMLEMTDEAQGCILRGFTKVAPALPGSYGPTFKFSSVSTSVGQSFCIEIFSEDFTDMQSAQLPIHWDPELVELENIDLTEGIDGFSWSQEVPNRIDLNWEYGPCPAGLTLQDDVLMIRLCFRWISPLTTTTAIEIGGGASMVKRPIGNMCYSIGLNHISATVQAQDMDCRLRDSLALIALYYDTEGGNWTNIWPVDQPMDTWFGVTLNDQGCVEMLDLSDNQLFGKIPAVLGVMDNLQALDLSGNQLTGSIPPGMGYWSQLSFLDLSGNQLSGHFPAPLQTLCGINYNFTNNPALPWQGDFSRYCSGEAQVGAPCDDSNPYTENDVIGINGGCLGTFPPLLVAPRVYLQGPYAPNTGLLDDNLRADNLLPQTEPYTALGYPHLGGGGETAQPSVFETTGPDAIVDWIFLELRDKSDPTTILATRSALLQADGDVVDTDGLSPITFADLPPDDYYLVVKHRNHLGVMTAAPVALSGAPAVVDFTTDLNQVAGGANGIAMLPDGKLGLFSGDFNGNGQVQNTDYADMVQTLGTAGYLPGDFDLNGQVQNTDLQFQLLPNIGRGAGGP